MKRFGLVIPEAWMSGTPVIASSNGAILGKFSTLRQGIRMPDRDGVSSGGSLTSTESRRGICREMALLNRFHYLTMARAYLEEYQRELGR